MIIKQAPADGTRLQPGETVTITVSLGPRFFPAPDFSNLSHDAAEALAAEYGLHVIFSTFPGTGGDAVFSQSPGVGWTVEYGDTIRLFMA
jgi:serine/threonine-protein kinase